ncbi:MAG TPA: nicotinate phosphoribosyltransferase [Anaerolineales bacterium]|nr:nicotinate phosphoribosyltransferase [Anaerolineales bacterium]
MKFAQKKIAEGMLYTDQYQLTMAQLYFRHGMHEKNAQFDYFFRSYPDYGSHKAGYCINAGLEWFLDWMEESCFGEQELAYLRGQHSASGERLFGDDFLDWLASDGNFSTINLKAVPEGRVVHPNTPVVVVQGGLAMAQILETSLLNHMTYQTLIATKASRIKESARGRLLLEFGLRRAQERAAVAGTRAALIGGADYSSNVGTSHVLGFPPKGTHAHSMVQVFMAMGGTEIDAFRAYAELYPDDTILLVDTISTVESGLPNAIRVFEELRKKGHKPVGIRLDSGDLAYLSIVSAKMLDEAGFPEVSIVLSNQLDELAIWQIITQVQEEATRYGVEPDSVINRLAYGVGTGLITSKDDAALDGVYKLVALEEEGEWIPAIKISETPQKTLIPGEKTLWRVYDSRGNATADLMTLKGENVHEQDTLRLRHPIIASMQRTLKKETITQIEPLLVDVVKNGEVVYIRPEIEKIRTQRAADLARLDPGVTRLVNPHIYHVSVSETLWQLKRSLIEKYKKRNSDES